MLVEGHVVIDVHRGAFSFRVFIRPVGQRSESRPVNRFKEFSSAFFKMLHDPVIDFFQERLHGLIDLIYAEEAPLSEWSKNPALNHLDSCLHLGFVSGSAYPGPVLLQNHNEGIDHHRWD